jgi:iron complex outermembrane receptor protein
VLGGHLQFNADFHKQSLFRTGDLVIKGYTVVDTRASLNGIGGTPVDVSVFVRNLFDKYYYGGGQSTSLTGTAVSSFFVAPPRAFGLQVRYRFGE